MHAFRNLFLEVILFRDGQWQCELIIGLPGVVVPTHRHMMAESYDLAIGGDGRASIGPRSMRVSELARRGPVEANLIRVPRAVWHGGEVGLDGGVWLSFQRWDGPAAWITDDWEER